MRPRLLEIEGLQSFRGVQRIDFESLGETGLFGIFGPTGSGKSTVLDAITFALYGKVKRAERGTQGIINANHNTVKVAFTFELLKGVRRIYRVERTYQRKKGSDSSCEPKVARLMEVSEAGDIPVCDKASEVGGYIEDLIGLNHDDFTRAVVLPQNSFQEFLMLDNLKKRGMLERIFYLEEYGKQLTGKLESKIAKTRSAFDMISGELLGYADASDTALEESRKLAEEALTERSRVEREWKRLEAQYNEAKTVWELTGELDLLKEKEQKHLVLKEDTDNKRILLEKAVKAGGLLDTLRRKRELSEKLEDTEKKLAEAADKQPETAVNLEVLRKELSRIRDEAADMQPRLVERRTRLVDALGMKKELDEAVKELQLLQNTLEGLKKDEIGEKNEVEKLKRELSDMEGTAAAMSGELSALHTPPEYRHKIQEGVILENALRDLNNRKAGFEMKALEHDEKIADLEFRRCEISKLITNDRKALEILETAKTEHEGRTPGDRNSLQRWKDELNLQINVLYNIKTKVSEIEEIKSGIAKRRLSMEGFEKSRLDSERNMAEAVRNRENCRQTLDGLLESLSRERDKNSALILSRKLREGEPCPVCGSTEHPEPLRDAIEKDAAELENKVEQARNDLSSAESKQKEAEIVCRITAEKVKSLSETSGLEEKRLEEKEKECVELRRKLPSGICDLDVLELETRLSGLVKDAGAGLDALDRWQEELESCKAGILELNNKISASRVIESGIISELNVNVENRRLNRIAFDEFTEDYIEKSNAYDAFLAEYGIIGAAAEYERLGASDRKADALRQQIEKLRAGVEIKRNAAELTGNELRTLSAKTAKTENEYENLKKQSEEKLKKLTELAAGTDIESAIAEIDAKLLEIAGKERAYGEKLESLEKQHSLLEAESKTLEEQRMFFHGSFMVETERLKAALEEKSFGDESEIERSMLSKDRQAALKAETDEYDQILVNITAQKKVLLKKLDNRTITGQEWEEISKSFSDLAACREESVSRSEVARNSYETVRLKHDRWIELSEKYAGLNSKLGLLETLRSLLRAEHGKDNSFIDYIAEERLRYVAAKASETLGLMTKYKYALELDADAGFVIRDNANGGIKRTVSSLSGGETFLTSLSLALALSEQIQLKGQSPLEFFFLDEGFGTLDNDLLDTVIDALERLSRKDRVIGLISHVPELRYRISRRLIVEPPSIHGEGSRVRIEKA